jgi:hypothetical protein
MRYSLRTLVVATVVAPPLIAVLWMLRDYFPWIVAAPIFAWGMAKSTVRAMRDAPKDAFSFFVIGGTILLCFVAGCALGSFGGLGGLALGGAIGGFVGLVVVINAVYKPRF